MTDPIFKGYKKVEGHNSDLGQGNWGKVLLYQDELGHKFAVKQQELTPLAESQKRERGLDERSLLEKECLHGNTRSLSGLAFNFTNYDEQGNPYLFIEPIDRILSDYIQGRSLSDQEIIKIIKGMADGLKSLHTTLKTTHGDLHPENIGYATDELIKIFDFGTSTVGNKYTENAGFILARAPERFSKQRIIYPSDIWSFGANVHKFINQQFPFEKEYLEIRERAKKEYNHETELLEFNQFVNKRFEEYITTLYNSRSIWNDVIHGKVKRLSTNKHFKSLLKNTLCDESTRIQNGNALVEEVNRTISKHEKSSWSSRTKRYGIVSGFSLLSLLGIYELNKNSREIQGLMELVQSSRKLISMKDKVATVRNFQISNLKKTYNKLEGEILEEERLEFLIKKFKDPLTAFAFYLDKNPPVTMWSILQRNKGITSYDSLKSDIKLLAPEIYGEMEHISRKNPDFFIYLEPGWAGKQMEDRVKTAQLIYNAKVDSLLAEYKNAKQTIKESHLSAGNNNFGRRAKQALDKQQEIFEKIKELTGKDIKELLAEKEQDSSQPE